MTDPQDPVPAWLSGKGGARPGGNRCADPADWASPFYRPGRDAV